MTTDLPASCFRYGLRLDDNDLEWNQAILLADHLSQLLHNPRVVFQLRSELKHDDKDLLALVIDSDRCNRSWLHLWDFAARLLNVLRIVVLASDDQQVFCSSADIELVFLQVSQVDEGDMSKTQITCVEPLT
mgnify:CR=1 FL=1